MLTLFLYKGAVAAKSGGFLIKELVFHGERAPSVPKISSVSRSLESGAIQAVIRAGAYTKTNMKLTSDQAQYDQSKTDASK